MAFALNYSTVWERFLEWYRGSWMDRAFAFLGDRVFVVAFGEYEKIPLSPTAGNTARTWILSLLVAFWITAVAMAFVKAVPGKFVRRLLALEAVDEAHAVTLAEAGCQKSAAVKRDLARAGALAKLVCRPGDGEKTVAGTPIPAPEEETDPETGEARPSLIERLEGAEKPAPSAPESEPVAPETETVAAESEPVATKTEVVEATEKAEEPTPAVKPLDFATDRFYIPKELRARAEARFAGRGSGVLSVVLSVLASTVAAFFVCNLLPLLFSLANRMLGG